MKEPPVFKVGQLVQFRFGIDLVTGVVTEDRGTIGLKGRRLYRILYKPDPDTEIWTELPAVDLEPVTAQKGKKGKP